MSSTPRTAGQEVARIAADNHGLITVSRLRTAGWLEAEIRRRVENGWLHRVHQGVYAVGHANLRAEARMLAAVLACGPGALLSHASAAWLWKLLPGHDGPIHVTTPGRRVRSRPGIISHRSTTFDPRDRRAKDGIPITSPTATIVGIAAIDARAAEEALNEALLHRLTSKDEVLRAIAKGGRRPGIKVMRQLERQMSGNDFSRREAEKILLRLIRTADLPPPRRNVKVSGFELDFYWPELRLNVETDGYQWHSTRTRLNRDRERDATLIAKGVHVLRFSFDQLKDRARTLARLAETIGRLRAEQ